MLAWPIYALIIAALAALAALAPSSAAELLCPSVLAPGSPISRQAWRYCVILDLVRKHGWPRSLAPNGNLAPQNYGPALINFDE